LSATDGGAYPATDSASAATALATGFKTDEGNIAWRTGDPANGRLSTIAEMYRNQKKAAIGVVSTVPFSHATPAGFVSHNVNRNNYKAIAQEIIAGVRPDVVIGGGNPNYNDAAGITGVNAYQYIDAPEYNYLKNYEGTWYPGTRIVDNTHIYKVMAEALGLADENRATVAGAQATTFLYTSDAHYGIKRSPVFGSYSTAVQVHGLMFRALNNMSNETLPCGDNGVNSCQTIGPIDFIAMTGDVSNRSESATTPVSKASAAVTWPQFATDYIYGRTLLKGNGALSDLFLTPGNHDVSNAIGYYKSPLNSAAGLDATSYVNIYNLMMQPATPLTNAAFVGAAPSFATAASSYAANRVVTSRDVNGVHLVFVGMWPDALTRPLIDANLSSVPATTPVILFTHDQPNAESKHFTNPNGARDINATDKFENLLSDIFADAATINDLSGNPIASVIEQQAFANWLKTHKNIVAYFHGNDNAFEAYTYTGPSNDISLPVFRVDSPMKGNVSATDPTKLSYSVITIDAAIRNMTVREYLWQQKKWGASSTIFLAARSN